MVEAREEIKEFIGFKDAAMNRGLKELAFRKAKYYREKDPEIRKTTTELVKEDYDARSHLS